MSEKQNLTLADFAPGDLVRLKSGGPVMTVEKTGKDAMFENELVWVTWFDKVGSRRLPARDTFAPALLLKHEQIGAMFVSRG